MTGTYVSVAWMFLELLVLFLDLLPGPEPTTDAFPWGDFGLPAPSSRREAEIGAFRRAGAPPDETHQDILDEEMRLYRGSLGDVDR